MRVLLIVAPFGLIEYPNLATSLLKAEARAAGFDCALRYVSIEFAKRIGFDLYRTIYTIDAQLLIPERIFAHALFGDRIPPWSEYWQKIVLPYEQPMNNRIRMPNAHESAAGTFNKLQQEAKAFVEDFASDPALARYQVFGFSTSYGQNCPSLALAKRLKELYPATRIVFGGANCAGGMGEKMLSLFPFIDYVCVEDGDLSFPQLLRCLAGGEPVAVPGILSRSEAAGEGQRRCAAPPPHQMVSDLDALPYPDFSDYFEAFGGPAGELTDTVAIPMETSRGCWWGEKHHCIFCGLNRDSMAYRKKSPQRIDAEARALIRQYDVKKIMMTDNIMSRSFFNDSLPLLARQPEHDQIFFEVKANFTAKELRQLKAARVDHLQPGIESLSTRVLQIMDKGVDCLQNVQLLKWSKELGIRVSWNILCGFPGEDAEDYEGMAKLIPKLHHLQPALGFSQITIDRFSPLFTNPGRFGIALQPSRGYRYVYPFAEEDIRALAYWFCQTGPHLDGTVTLAPPDYARSAYQAFVIWSRIHSRVDFSYRQLARDAVLVHDTRGVSTGTERLLDPLETRVFAALDRRQTLASLMRDLAQPTQAVPREAEVRAVLERFREWSYIHEDNGKILALATRQNSPTASAELDSLDDALGNRRMATV